MPPLDPDDLAGLVIATAAEMRERLPRHRTWRELIGPGWIAAARAAGRWDPSRGLKPSTYLLHRIRGAMLDEITDETVMWRRIRRSTEWTADRPSPPAPWNAVDELDAFDVLIGSLPPFQQELLREQYIEDLDAHESGRRHGISCWVVWKWRRRARNTLRTALERRH